MATIICSNCGAANDAGARFCVRCDTYLDWDDNTLLETPGDQPNIPVTQAFEARVAPPPRTDTSARPPEVAVTVTNATLDPHTPAQFELRVRNTSKIVDAFRVDMVGAPPWLVIESAEVRVLPDEDATLLAVLAIEPGARVAAQTVDVTLRVSSLRDTDQFVYTGVSLTVARSGAPLKLDVRPALIRLGDTRDGRFHAVLDNSDSNFGRRVTIDVTDDQAAMDFVVDPPTVDVAPGARAEVEVRFRVPDLPAGASETRAVDVTATDAGNAINARLTVQQQRSAAQPLVMRLEPSVLRATDRHDATCNAVIDNRNGRQDRTVDFHGRDPEGVMRFAFAKSRIVVPPGQLAAVRVGVWGPLPAPGDEVQRQFVLVASEAGRDVEAAGTLVSSMSPPKPVKRFPWAKVLLAAAALAAVAVSAVAVLALTGSPGDEEPTVGPEASADSSTKTSATSGTSATTTQPDPSGPPEQTVLPGDDGADDGVAFVEDSRGELRCQVHQAGVSCEGDFDGAPEFDGVLQNVVIIAPGGKFDWSAGNFGADQAVTLDDAVYHAEGWTITVTADGMSFRNDRTGRGVFVGPTDVHSE